MSSWKIWLLQLITSCPIAMMARLRTAKRGDASWGSRACLMEAWKLTSRPGDREREECCQHRCLVWKTLIHLCLMLREANLPHYQEFWANPLSLFESVLGALRKRGLTKMMPVTRSVNAILNPLTKLWHGVNSGTVGERLSGDCHLRGWGWEVKGGLRVLSITIQL
jgi:hypothetical protein